MRRKILIEKQEQEITNKTPFKSLFAASQEHYIQTTLEQADWNISKAARKLGITRQSLQYHIKKHGLVR
ncbi:helix-turn-helix domain-containing protein [Bacillus sp. N9]